MKRPIVQCSRLHTHNTRSTFFPLIPAPKKKNSSILKNAGINLKINDEISSFINKGNLVLPDSNTSPTAVYKVGDEQTALVVDINPRNKKVLLSLKEFKKRENLADYEKYLSSEKSDSSSGYSLGDIFKDKKDEG